MAGLHLFRIKKRRCVAVFVQSDEGNEDFSVEAEGQTSATTSNTENRSLQK